MSKPGSRPLIEGGAVVAIGATIVALVPSSGQLHSWSPDRDVSGSRSGPDRCRADTGGAWSRRSGLIWSIVVVICFAGAFTTNSNPFDVYLMIFFGVLGYGMKRLGFPIPPLMMGYILGSLMGTSLVQLLILGDGSIVALVTRPISLVFLLLTLFFLLWPVVLQRKRALKNGSS